MRHLREADAEIDRAVREIDHAAVIDHKDLEDHPSIDRSLDRRGRSTRPWNCYRAPAPISAVRKTTRAPSAGVTKPIAISTLR